MRSFRRRRYPHRGFIPPDMFVDLAEETGHIIPLAGWVAGQAIRDQARLREAGKICALR
ncbi:MAG: hypothetical protein LAT81_07905 [Oceanicaulis sp.]|nr:hypothetical protein [Oceanicaulis sp.]